MSRRRGDWRRRRRWRRSHGHGGRPDHYFLDQRDDTPLTGGGDAHGIFQVGNVTLNDGLVRWLDARHAKLRCTPSTPVYFAPFSPNGIGNKIMAVVMAFHIALMEGRALIVSDWPPKTLTTTYKVEDFLQPSGCQGLFDSDTHRPKVTKCSVAGCPTRTKSRFTDGRTQPHWAHQSMQFLDLPRAWAHLDWLTWWRTLTQYLLQPGPRLLRGLSQTLRRAMLLRSSGSRATSSSTSTSSSSAATYSSAAAAATVAWLQHVGDEAGGDAAAARTAAQLTGFGARFAAGVARCGGALRRPLVGVHVRLGDGCGDLKRGGCKYVRSFGDAVTRLREAGIRSGTLFVATDLTLTPNLTLTLTIPHYSDP